MKMYADTPVRRTLQLVGDLLFLVWLVAWVWVGGVVHDGTAALAEPGHAISGAATSLGAGLAEAGGRLGDVPLVGDGIAVPFDRAAAASGRLAEAGQAEARAAERLGFWLGLSIAAIPILVVTAFYLPGRVGSRAARDRRRPLRRCRRGPRPLRPAGAGTPADAPVGEHQRRSAGDWRRRDADVIRRLGELELRACGLRAPSRA
ncbi:MAG: hypothetical protein R2734_00830 [Nocardioides sp.]